MFRTASVTLVAIVILGTACLNPAIAQRFDSIQKSNGIVLGQFNSVYVAPVKVELAGERQREKDFVKDRIPSRFPNIALSEQDQRRNAAQLQQDLTRAFGKRFTLVEAPGDGVLTVDATITRLLSTLPTGRDLGRSVGLSPNSVSAGGASFFVELKEQDLALATIEERHQTTLNDGVPRVGIWQDAERSFGKFSRNLAKYVSRN